MYIAPLLLAVGLLAYLVRSRKLSLTNAIIAFARSMDITPLYARSPRRNL